MYGGKRRPADIRRDSLEILADLSDGALLRERKEGSALKGPLRALITFHNPAAPDSWLQSGQQHGARFRSHLDGLRSAFRLSLEKAADLFH